MSVVADYGLRRLLLRITLRDVDPPEDCGGPPGHA